MATFSKMSVITFAFALVSSTITCVVLDLKGKGKCEYGHVMDEYKWETIATEVTFSESCCKPDEPEKPVPGGWTTWSTAHCSVTCGTGTESRSRSCTNPSPSNGGANCTGDAYDGQTCTRDPCSDPPISSIMCYQLERTGKCQNGHVIDEYKSETVATEVTYSESCCKPVGPCQKEQEQLQDLRSQIMDAPLPECNRDGTWKGVQSYLVNGTAKVYYCVDTSTGVKKNCASVCSMQKDAGYCSSRHTYFYFDPKGEKGEKCKEFVYGGCKGNDNRFETKDECNQVCPPSPSISNSKKNR